MSRIVIRTISILIIFAQCVLSFAQEDHHHHGADSTKSQDISPFYMPVSYAFIEPHQFAPLSFTNVDTSLINTHYYIDILRVENLYQSLGNIGQAHQQINFDFQHDRGFTYFSYPYPLLFMRQKDLKYYDVKTAYTRLAFSYGFPNENTFHATHAQKIKQVNFGFNIKASDDKGWYVNENSRYFIGSAYVHYELPSKIYGFRVGYIFNRVNHQENSGMMDSTKDHIETRGFHDFLSDGDRSSDYTFRTEKATNLVATHDILLQQYVNLKFKKEGNSFGFLTHSFQYQSHKNQYLDPALDTARYEHLYFSNDSTVDSLHFYQISNTLQWSTFNPYHPVGDKKNFIHAAAGITHDYMKERAVRINFNSEANAKETLPQFASSSFTVFGRVYTRFLSVTDINGSISYTFGGYNNNDAIADASISWAINRKNRHYIGFTGNYYRISPDYIYTYYSGNQLRWENDWDKQNILKLGAYWRRKEISANFNYFLLNNYAYFDQNLMPNALEEVANVIQLHFASPMRIRNFGFNTNLYLQHSDNDVVQLPLFAGKLSVFYIFKIFKRKLQIQIQTDLMYNTIYEAYGYSPMLRQFYHQEGFTNGNYLYLDVNLNLQIDRLGFFIRGNNLLAGVLGNNYFTTPYYPMEKRSFQIGVNWRFYD